MSMQQADEQQHHGQSHDSIDSQSIDTVSTCVSKYTSTARTRSSNNNFEYVLQLLDVTFKGFSRSTAGERPVESMGAIVSRILQVDSLLEFIQNKEQPALICPKTRGHITHRQLYNFLRNQFTLAKFNLFRGARVATCLPESPTLAVLLLGIISYCTCTPCHSSLSPEELVDAYQTMNVQAVVMPLARLTDNTDPLPGILRENGFQLIGLHKQHDKDIFFTLHPDPLAEPLVIDDDGLALLNQADDTVLVLQTSGTSGKKKSVPYRLRHLCVSTTCVAASIGVASDYININTMPLYHVGGIIRSLFVPIFTGGAMIQFQTFNALDFWETVAEHNNSFWYYGVPTLHQAIVAQGQQLDLSTKVRHRMRIISNGGGALAPHLAKQMQECFPNAVVMPSYGMTECMPMTAPPRDYDLDCEGSSGLPIGPEMAIAADGMMVAQDGVIGHIMVRGPPCFEGYEGVDIDTTFDANGWFDTGDVGYFKDSYLYITGRSKEIINRGGEVISPLEIEQALISHPKLAQVMAFSTPHETLQETIGLILVVKENESRPDLRSLRPFLERVLHPSKWPQLLVYMSDLPKSAVNKPLRINVSQRMQLPTVMEADGNIHQKQHLYEADCPEAGAPLDELISCRPVQWENQQLLDVLHAHPDVEDGATYVHPATKQLCVFLVASQQNKTANTTTTTLPVESYSTVIQMDDGSDNESSRASTMMNWRHDKEAKEAIVQRVQLYLERHIHDYMLPKRMLVVDHLPEKNLDGSLDDDHARHLLDQHQNQQPDDGTHANDPVVVALRDLFAQVLGLSKNDYPLDGDFFDHGGNSLKSSSLFSLIRVRLAIDLPLTLLYEKHARSPVQLAPHCYERIDVKTHPLVTLGYDAYMKRPRTTSMLSYTTNTSIFMDDASKKKKLKRRLRTPQAFRSFGTQKYKDRMAKRPDSGAYDPFSLISMVWQALPAFFFMPLGIGIRWFIFAMSLGSLSQVMPTTGASHSILRLVQVILALVITSILANLLAPVVAITSKWLLIGRYRAGKYRLWSWYYLRWWLAYRFVLISGPGILACSDRTFCWYLRMLGAKVGRGCSINVEIDIGEFDLLVIGDHCSLDKVNLRPFHLERGHMVLEPITIGNNCAVGYRTVIVSGTSIPSNHVIGPMTTTYARDMANIGSCAHKDTPEGMALLDAVMVGSMTSNRLHPILYCFVVLPVMGLLYLVSMIPWMIVMYMLSKDLSVVHSVSRGSLFSKLVLYFAGPSRVGYHLLAVAVKHNVVPILHLVLAIIIKRLFMKRTVPGARTDDNQLTELRYALQRALLDPKELTVVFSMLGSHYELVSIVYRLLGAKVGKRVYWPGTCINTYDYDLIEVGDDVVFGSRSSFFCMDEHDRLPIKVRDGAMIADNCALYPGAEVGHGALLGTGGLLNKHGHVPDGSAWYGSFNGQPVKFRDEAPSEKKTALNGNGTGPDDEILGRRVFDNPGTPFGRAFYQGKSSYFVLGFWFVVPYNILARMVGSAYWGCAVTTAIQLSAIFIRANDEAFSNTPSDAQHQSFLSNLFHDGHEWIEVGIVLGAIIVLWNFMTVLGLALEIGCKWTLFGQRQPGQYNWDQSSYCQRWQILISFQQMFRRRFTHLAGGSAWVILYYRLFGARIGRRVCLYPNGGDPVMTEPDLVMLEDDVAVDFASLVCHMNTLGSFTVNPLKVGAGSVLRTGARLASGATMMEDCTLLEHTLILPGAVADRGTTWQGYPGEQVKHS